MKRLSIVCLILVCLAAFMFAGCGQSTKEAPPEKKMITITDSYGRYVDVPCPPERVVVINADVAEVICALGETDKIVGVSQTTDFPAHLKDVDKVGKSFTPSVEKILELQPDVVFGYGKFLKPELAEKIKAAGIPLVCIDCYKIETLANDIKILGLIFDKKERAEEYVDLMNKYLNMVKEKTKKLKPEEKTLVYWEGYSDYKTVAAGSGGHEMVKMAGGLNIAAGEPVPYPKISSEWILEKNPQVIVKAAGSKIPCGYGITEPEAMKLKRDEIMQRAGWGELDAVKNGKVYILSSEISTAARSVVGICCLAKWFYPNLFEDLNPEAVHKEFLQKFHGLEHNGLWVHP